MVQKICASILPTATTAVTGVQTLNTSTPAGAFPGTPVLLLVCHPDLLFFLGSSPTVSPDYQDRALSSKT